jgi:hypothetical protein
MYEIEQSDCCHVVADPSGAVRAEMRQVLAELGRIDAGCLGQVLGRHRRGAALRDLDERAQVDRQAPNGGLGDGSDAHAARLARS